MDPGPHGDVAWPTQQLHEEFVQNRGGTEGEQAEWTYVSASAKNSENRAQKIFTSNNQYRKRSMP